MKPLITSLNGKTVLLLESREVDEIRTALQEGPVWPEDRFKLAEDAFTRGIQRGLEHLQAEFKQGKR